jgi:DNA excision repair protein ERCC-2
MSGTLYPMGMYAGILGVPNDRARLERYQNPFPEENRKVAIDPGVSSKATERGPEMYRRIASTIQDVGEHTPGNVAAFFPSYAMMSSVNNALGRTRRRLLVEERSFDKEAREDLVKRLERADGNALLLGVQGGSLSEGYDFELDGENLLKSVLVVGVPYAPPTTEVQALQDFFDERFGDGKGWQYGYLAPAIQRTLQAAGRAVRAAHHEAFVGLLDRRFNQRQIQSWLPPDMNPDVEQDIAGAAKRFFDGR